jgi:hypothetical protein
MIHVNAATILLMLYMLQEMSVLFYYDFIMVLALGKTDLVTAIMYPYDGIHLKERLLWYLSATPYRQSSSIFLFLEGASTAVLLRPR